MIIDDITSRVPRIIETGFGPLARHMSFESALTKIGEKLGRPIVCSTFLIFYHEFRK